MPEGGVTPSYGTVALARELRDMALYVIIRPRGGDFLYSDPEFEVMLRDIEAVRRLGVDGVVTGCLTAEGEVDVARNRELVAAAGGMSVTFHRAFDVCRDPFESLERIISLGFRRILSSGQRQRAVEGLPLLRELVRRAGRRIIIMPGSGINAHNIATIARETGAVEFHLSARGVTESGMTYRHPGVSMGAGAAAIDEYAQQVTDARLVRMALEALHSADCRGGRPSPPDVEEIE
jgi:copper homeostasis protein